MLPAPARPFASVERGVGVVCTRCFEGLILLDRHSADAARTFVHSNCKAQMEATVQRELYGGAILVQLPPRFADVRCAVIAGGGHAAQQRSSPRVQQRPGVQLRVAVLLSARHAAATFGPCRTIKRCGQTRARTSRWWWRLSSTTQLWRTQTAQGDCSLPSCWDVQGRACGAVTVNASQRRGLLFAPQAHVAGPGGRQPERQRHAAGRAGAQ